mgnify:FL=1|tara:strand:- start:824 stop:1066 length:243 start_codon:yes stop_codon:yes gene_type:complete
MATDLKSQAQHVDLTRFWGGKDKGTCIQITTPAQKPLARTSYFDTVQLTRTQAAALGKDLLEFAKGNEQVDDLWDPADQK